MMLEELFGYTAEIRVLDFVLPLDEDISFHIEQVERGVNLDFRKSHKILDSLTEWKILCRTGIDEKPVYSVNKKSNLVRALKNLIFACYANKLQGESLQAMKQKIKLKNGVKKDGQDQHK